MKLKGINPIEQHIEKIVLVLMAAVLLAVVAMQFLVEPNQIDANGRKIPPQDIYKTLESQATSLDAQLKDQNPALPEVPAIDLVERYERAFADTGAGRTTLVAPLAQGVSVGRLVGTDLSNQAPTEEEVSPLRVPTTTGVVAGSQWGTLDPYAVLAVPAYEAFVPSAQPFDFASVTIESVFSGSALRDALSSEEGAGIPRRFWQGTGLAIMAYEVERQRLLPDGSWSQPEAITTPPTTPIPVRAMGADDGLPELTGLVSSAVEVSDVVERPPFPPTIAGREWVPPSERIADDGELTEADRIRRRLQRAEAELARLEDRPDPRDDRNTGGKFGRNSDPDRDRQQPDRSRDRVQQLRDEIRDFREQLRELGEDAPDPSDRARRPRGSQPELLLARDSIQLWAHDMGVQPGNQYRYRTRVAVNNPLFRKGSVLDPDNAELQQASNQPFARSEWSEWSQPVLVGATEYFFVNAASPQGTAASSTPTASIELFKVYFGSYRRSSLTMTPGDAIGTDIRVPEGLLTVDAESVPLTEATKVFEAMSARERGDEPIEMPAGIAEATGRLTIDLGAYVLDIVTRPVQAADQFGTMRPVGEVVLRNRDGSIVSRTTVGDAGSQAYSLARGSASESSELSLRAPGSPAVIPGSELFVPADQRP